MTLCPMAIAVGCKKCLIVSVCPLKTVIGDYKKAEKPKPKSGKTGKTASKNSKPEKLPRKAARPEKLRPKAPRPEKPCQKETRQGRRRQKHTGGKIRGKEQKKEMI